MGLQCTDLSLCAGTVLRLCYVRELKTHSICLARDLGHNGLHYAGCEQHGVFFCVTSCKDRIRSLSLNSTIG